MSSYPTLAPSRPSRSPVSLFRTPARDGVLPPLRAAQFERTALPPRTGGQRQRAERPGRVPYPPRVPGPAPLATVAASAYARRSAASAGTPTRLGVGDHDHRRRRRGRPRARRRRRRRAATKGPAAIRPLSSSAATAAVVPGVREEAQHACGTPLPRGASAPQPVPAGPAPRGPRGRNVAPRGASRRTGTRPAAPSVRPTPASSRDPGGAPGLTPGAASVRPRTRVPGSRPPTTSPGSALP